MKSNGIIFASLRLCAFALLCIPSQAQTIFTAGWLAIFGSPALTPTANGLLMNATFASVSGWNQFSGSSFTSDATAPEFVFYPHATPFLYRTVTNNDSGVIREPTPIRLANGTLLPQYDAYDGSHAWASSWSHSPDNGVTWDMRAQKDSLTLTGSYIGFGNSFMWLSNSTYYRICYNWTSSGGANIPSPPYGNTIFSNPSPTNGTWTQINDNNPPIGGAGTFYQGENVVYHIWSNAITGAWEADTAASDVGNTSYLWGRWTNRTFSGAGTYSLDTTNVMPNTVHSPTYGMPENPRLFFSSALNTWVMNANEINPASSVNRLGLWYASTYPNFTSSVRHISAQDSISQYMSTAVGPASPVYNLQNTAIEDASGAFGMLYSTYSSSTGEGGFLGAGQLEPHAAALAYSGTPNPAYIITNQPAANFIGEYTLEYQNATGGGCQFIFNATSDGTDGGTTCYLIQMDGNSTACAIYKVTSGTFTAEAGPSNCPPFQFTPNSVNQFHERCKLIKNAGYIELDINGSNVVSWTDGSPLTGTHLGFRGTGNPIRCLGLSLRSADTVTITGVTNGDQVALLGAQHLKAVAATATGTSITLSHYHFPLYGIQINGKTFDYPAGVWGGNTYALSSLVAQPAHTPDYAWFKLNEGTGATAADSTANANTLNLTASPSWVTGASGSGHALTFNGSSQYGTALNSGINIQDTTPFSITAWVKSSALADAQAVIATWHYLTAAGVRLLISPAADGTVDLLMGNAAAAGVREIHGNANVCDGAWHFIAATSDGSGTANGYRLYVDGVPDLTIVTSDTAPGLLDNDAIYLARIGGGTPQFFTGSIDDPHIYSYMLTPTNIINTFNAGAQ